MTPKNYRGITLINNISQVYSHNNIIDNQFGFQKKCQLSTLFSATIHNNKDGNGYTVHLSTLRNDLNI